MQQRSPSRRTWVALAVAVTVTVSVPVPLRAAKQRVKLTTLAPQGSSPHRALQAMGQAWREVSGGTVDLVIYPGGIQGGEAAMVERMWVNQSQAAMLTAVGLELIEPAVAGLQNMPMMFRSLEEVDHVAAKLRPVLEKRLAEKGFVVLFWGDTGWVRFFSREPVQRVEDLKKLKLFAWAGDTDTIRIMNAAGLRPVPLETADILTGLQTGLIDAVPLPPFYALASQVYTTAPHMLELDWAPLVGATVITKRAWAAIPETLRPALAAAAVETGAEITATARRESAESVRVMREKWKLTVHTVPPQIEQEWRDAAEAAYPEIRGTIVPAEIFDEVRRILRDYRSSAGTSD